MLPTVTRRGVSRKQIRYVDGKANNLKDVINYVNTLFPEHV